MPAPIPPVTPYLIVSDAHAAIDFYKKALSAVPEGEVHLMPGTDKVMHARLLIEGGMIMLADDYDSMNGGTPQHPEALGGTSITLALQVGDAQAFWDTAVAGGVTVTMPLAVMFWGDLYGQFTCPFGHKWSVSQNVKQMSDEEMQQAAEEAMADKGTLMGEPV